MVDIPKVTAPCLPFTLLTHTSISLHYNIIFFSFLNLNKYIYLFIGYYDSINSLTQLWSDFYFTL